jgi:predicted DNA-binding mobile mystery protein A
LYYHIHPELKEASMKTGFRELRLHQLTQALVPFRDAESAVRPSRGWLRAIRESLGLTLEQVGRAMDRTRQDTLAFERSEAEDRITLKSLRRVAEAMGCELVYAVIPKSGTMRELAERNARQEAAQRVLAVEHSMALEAQAAGGVDDRIERETRRILKKS